MRGDWRCAATLPDRGATERNRRGRASKRAPRLPVPCQLPKGKPAAFARRIPAFVSVIAGPFQNSLMNVNELIQVQQQQTVVL